MVQRDLTMPYLEQSLAAYSPQAKNVGVLIAESFRSLHLLTPVMQQSIRTLIHSPPGSQEALSASKALSGRDRQFTSLMRQLKASQS